MKRTLHFFVKTDMRELNLPSENNRAYYPTNSDIKNHIDAAKTVIQLSKFDQVTMKALYDEWTNQLSDPVPTVAKEVVLESTEGTPLPSIECTSPTLPSVPEQSTFSVQP